MWNTRWLVLGSALVVACGPGEATDPEVESHIATDGEFANYKSWPQYVVATDVPSTDEHGGGKHIAYINKLPPSGSQQFPTGTIIVKEAVDAEGKVSDRIHAMVKRNGGFNAQGAYGWEWFEITPSTQGVPVTRWRGASPPNGSGYVDPGTTNPAGDCNKCHSAASTNDYVQSAPLKLSSF